MAVENGMANWEAIWLSAIRAPMMRASLVFDVVDFRIGDVRVIAVFRERG